MISMIAGHRVRILGRRGHSSSPSRFLLVDTTSGSRRILCARLDPPPHARATGAEDNIALVSYRPFSLILNQRPRHNHTRPIGADETAITSGASVVPAPHRPTHTTGEGRRTRARRTGVIRRDDEGRMQSRRSPLQPCQRQHLSGEAASEPRCEDTRRATRRARRQPEGCT